MTKLQLRLLGGQSFWNILFLRAEAREAERRIGRAVVLFFILLPESLLVVALDRGNVQLTVVHHEVIFGNSLEFKVISDHFLVISVILTFSANPFSCLCVLIMNFLVLVVEKTEVVAIYLVVERF